MKHRNILFLAFILAFNIIFFQETLRFYFISDDFFFLSSKTISDAISFKPNFNHYIPVFWSTIWLVKSIFGLNPLIFHFVTLSVHLLNVILVYLLGKLLIKDKKSALLVAVTFSFFFSHYEVIYWITGLSTSLMVFFYLLGFITFLKFIENKKKVYYILFLLSFLLAVFSHEYALSLPLTCFIYYLLFTKKKNKLIESTKLFSFPFLILFLIFILKVSQLNTQLVVQYPDSTRFIISIIKSFLYLFIPNPSFIDFLPKILLVFSGIILISFLILKSYPPAGGSKLNLFLLTWLFITVVIFSATSLPQARYFYLSSIPAILLIISLLNSSRLLKSVGFIYITFILLSGIVFLKYQELLWTKSSTITKNIIETLEKDSAKENINQPIYVIDLLDSVNGPPWQAYVFRNGLEDAIFIYTGKKIKINYLRTVGEGGRVRHDPTTTWKDIHILLDKGETVYQFDNGPDTISRLQKL